MMTTISEEKTQEKNEKHLFDDVVGQKHVINTLLKMHRSGRYPNALMFHGKPGVGKHFLARRFATMVVASSDPIIDDVREIQRMVDNDEHPDVHHFHHGDAASFKIDLVREAIAEARKPSFRSDVKVVILEDIHKFPSYQQSDALLKAVEDGTGGTMFIFTTEDYHAVMDTLKSRCTPVQFAPLREAELHTILSDYAGRDHFNIACRLADGSLDRAIRFLEPPEDDLLSGHQMRVRAFRLLTHLDSIACHAIIKFLDSLVPKKDAVLFGEVVASIVRDVLVLKGSNTPDEASIVHYDMMESLVTLDEKWKLEQVVEAFQAIREFHERAEHGSGLQYQHHLKNMVLRMQEAVEDE